jgi:predicted nucleotidyltransferase
LKRANFALLYDLQELLGQPVDLLTDRAMTNPIFRKHANASRILLYAA